MPRDLSKILVIDVESTFSREVRIPANEIIEIGMCFLNVNDLSVEKMGSIVVKPRLITSLPNDCVEATSLTDEIVFQGVDFKDACRQLKKISKTYTWASWGVYDRRQFERQTKADGIAYPLGVSHINIKNLFALKKKLESETCLMEALELENMQFEGHWHRGQDDAHMAAKLLANLLRES